MLHSFIEFIYRTHPALLPSLEIRYTNPVIPPTGEYIGILNCSAILNAFKQCSYREDSDW
jgi:hypothetical protein